MTIERTVGLILVLSAVVTFPGLMMFTFRRGYRGGAPRSAVHFAWERSFVMAGVILEVIGFVLLATALQNTDGRVWGIIGATGFLFGAILLVTAEASSLTFGYEKLYPLIVIYVVMAFLAQAVIGGAWLQGGLAWIGWATIVWNLAWLIVLPIFSRRDIYFPILHSVMPLVMGIALLWTG